MAVTGPGKPADQGQRVWLNQLSRDLLRTGRLARLIEQGVAGVSTDLAVFESALASADAYGQEIARLALKGLGDDEIWSRLWLEDARFACDQLAPLFAASQHRDGFVSLGLAVGSDPTATVAAAASLRAAVDRPNLMIGIPATRPGLAAIEDATSRGLSVNATLIFGARRHREVVEAYCRGLERRLAAGLPLAEVSSVASLPISQLDGEVDRRLAALAAGAKGDAQAELELARGTAGIATATLAYRAFGESFQSSRFELLGAAGATPQRLLWVGGGAEGSGGGIAGEPLIAAETINSLPLAALEAFLADGRAGFPLAERQSQGPLRISLSPRLGVEVEAAAEVLAAQGLAGLAAAEQQLGETVSAQRARLVGTGAVASPRTRFVATATPAEARLGPAQAAVAAQLASWVSGDAPRAIVAPGSTPEGDAIHRLRLRLDQFWAHSAWVRDRGFSRALLVEADGGGLGPRVLRRAFGVIGGFPDLAVIGSVHPDLVGATAAVLDPASTLLLAASSGGAGRNETLALTSYFHDLLTRPTSLREPAANLAAAEPGSELEQLATRLGFGRVLAIYPEAAGASSVLSELGLLAAATMGIDLEQLLAGVAAMAAACATSVPLANPAMHLAAILAGCASQGRNKVTFCADPELTELPAWIGQLWGEELGGSQLVPIVGELPQAAAAYGPDRLFVYLHLEGSADADSSQGWLDGLANSGQPVVRITTAHRLDLGGEFLRWKLAAAWLRAGSDLVGSPPRQLDEGERELEEVLGVWRSGRGLPRPAGELGTRSLEISEAATVEQVAAALGPWLEGIQPPGYIAVAAHIPALGEGEEAGDWLRRLRASLSQATGCATTEGWLKPGSNAGPLPSGAGQVAFLQLTSDPTGDRAIPGRAYSFGVLQQARTLSEYLLARDQGARVLRIHLGHGGSGLALVAQAAARLGAPELDSKSPPAPVEAQPLAGLGMTGSWE